MTNQSPAGKEAHERALVDVAEYAFHYIGALTRNEAFDIANRYRKSMQEQGYYMVNLDSAEVVEKVAEGIANHQSHAPTMGKKWINGVPTPYVRIAKAALQTLKTMSGGE